MLEPLQDEFMRRAIAEMALIGLAGGALGCWIVLYEFSYAAESLAHSLFPGLVLAALTGIPLLLGATPAILVAALAIVLAARASGISRDVAVAIVVTTMFGLGALLALSPDSPPGIEALLFGDILGPTDADLAAAAAMAIVIPAALWALHSRLLSSGFDRAAAAALGVSPGRVEALLAVLLAAATVVSVQGLGNLLVVAVLVGPAAAARQLSDRIVPMLFLAAGIAVLAGVAGLYASYYLGTAAGASIALAMFAAYLLSLPIGRLRAWRGSPGPAKPRATIA
ncbi:MAG TPA: metal ABC transporter permease [Solirubrobacterales bacterium]|nr:metal ABC transporter permease [Solirubrobacterales bacterium]